MASELVTPVSANLIKGLQNLARARMSWPIDEHDAGMFSMVSNALHVIMDLAGRQLGKATWRDHLDAFPDGSEPLRLEIVPLNEVQSIKYIDSNGEEQDFEDFQVDSVSEPGRIAPNPGKYWPATQSKRFGAVTITYIAGLEDTAEQMPGPALEAVLTLAAFWFDAPDMQGRLPDHIKDQIEQQIWLLRPRLYC